MRECEKWWTPNIRSRHTHTCKNTREQKNEQLTLQKTKIHYDFTLFPIPILLKYCSLLNGNEPAKCSCQLSLTWCQFKTVHSLCLSLFPTVDVVQFICNLETKTKPNQTKSMCILLQSFVVHGGDLWNFHFLLCINQNETNRLLILY